MPQPAPGSAARLLRQGGPGRTALLLVLAIALAACSSPGGAAANGPATTTQAASPAASPAKLSVASTLDGHATLPLRIHWQAFPSAPAGDVSEIDFLIDGRLGWVEHNTPYFYGDNGNWLVTSFLTPGKHTFTVRVITANGHTATDTVKASVTTAPPPPATIAGMWTHTVTAAAQKKFASGNPGPTGRWRLRIDSTGWQLRDPTGGGSGVLIDVQYQTSGNVQLRPAIEYPPYPNNNNGGFCADVDPVWTWSYSVTDGGKTLKLRPVGHDPCGGRTAIFDGTWTRAGK